MLDRKFNVRFRLEMENTNSNTVTADSVLQGFTPLVNNLDEARKALAYWEMEVENCNCVIEALVGDQAAYNETRDARLVGLGSLNELACANLKAAQANVTLKKGIIQGLLRQLTTLQQTLDVVD